MLMCEEDQGEQGWGGCAAVGLEDPRRAIGLRRLWHLRFDLPVELQGFVAKTPDLPTLSHCRDEIQWAEHIFQPAAFCRASIEFAIAIRHAHPSCHRNIVSPTSSDRTQLLCEYPQTSIPVVPR